MAVRRCSVRLAYLHVLRALGLADHHALSLYRHVIDPSCWTPHPDTADVLKALSTRGIRTAVRPAFEALGAAEAVDEFVLSFEVGVMKPDPAIFRIALQRLDVSAADAVMVGDSNETDSGARDVGCGFVLIDPLPTA